MNKLYLENGNAIKTEWEGSIALSYIPIYGRALPYALTIEKYTDAGGDFASSTINVTPVVIANKYWVIKNNAGTIQTTHYFTNFTMSGSGSFRIRYEKDGSGNVTIQIYDGKGGTTLVYDSATGKNERKITYTLNASIPVSTTFEGYIEYENNVICIGTEVKLILGATERARCYAAATTPLYTVSENQVRFYVKEKGSYKLLDDTDAASKEINEASLLCDTLINKSFITELVKCDVDNSVNLIMESDLPIKITAGQVVNKPTFVNTQPGLSLMFNTIQGWL